jgi:hypothetical protein
MKYTLTWQDFMRQPENMQLKESKGIFACKQKYIQEQNKLAWIDPMIINEAAGDAGTTNAANAPYGGSTQFITGNAAEISTFTFAHGVATDHVNAGISGSGHDGAYFDIEGYDNTTDYSAGHMNSMRKFRCYFHTGSTTFAPTVPSDIHGIVTASGETLQQVAKGTPAGANITASITAQWSHAIANQAAGAVVAGYTNTIAPSTYFTAVSSSAGSVLTVTNKYKAGVEAITSNGWVAASASVATTTTGLDTFHNEQGVQIFDGDKLPYNNMPRKAN